MRYILMGIAFLSLLGAVLFFIAGSRDPMAFIGTGVCVLLFVVAGGVASIIDRMIEWEKRQMAALKDIAASNAAMSIAIQNRSKTV